MKELQKVQASEKITVYPKISDAAQIFGKFMAEYSPKDISPRLISGKYNEAMRKPAENKDLARKVQERKNGVKAAANTITKAVATGDFVGSMALVHKKIVAVRAELAEKKINEFEAAQSIAHWNKVFEILQYLRLFCPVCEGEKPGSRDYDRYEELKDIKTRSEDASFNPFTESTRSAFIAFQAQQKRKAEREAKRTASSAAKVAPKPPEEGGEAEPEKDYSSLFGESGTAGGEENNLSPAKEDQIAWSITPDGMRALTDEARWEKKAPAQGKILKLLNHGKKSQAFIISSLGSLKDSLNRLKNNNLITEIQVRDMSEEDLQREADVKSGKVTIEQALEAGKVSTSARPADTATPPARGPARRPAAKKEEEPESKEEQTSGDLFGYKPTETKLDIDVSVAAKAPTSEPPKPSAAEPKSFLPAAKISDEEIQNIIVTSNENISEEYLEEIKKIVNKDEELTDLCVIDFYYQILPYLEQECRLQIPKVVSKGYRSWLRLIRCYSKSNRQEWSGEVAGLMLLSH
jgi:hypothetical protein